MPKKLKTETWLKKLPEPYAKLALANFKKYELPNSKHSESLCEAVSSFAWSRTEETEFFWGSVFDWAAWTPPPRPKRPKLPKLTKKKK